MPVFPSREWMEAFCARLAAKPEAARVARELDGVYRFAVEPAGPLTEPHRYDVGIRPSPDGAVVGLLDEPAEPRLTLTADYERWRQLVLGQLDVGMAVLMRRLRVSGDLSMLTQRLSSTRPLVDALREVDSQWLG